MQNVQNVADFIQKFMTEASIFGLHLDASPDNIGPFKSVTGELLVSRVMDLTDTFVFVSASGHVLVLDGSIGMSFPARWTSKAVGTVEELADFIKLRRAVQNGRWN